ncbi:hypothetical protein G9A89_023621 [Geosiphon pyriformis]|nr:hypothetical protein G9A89_023621 [Geosiphon pyriformis]
MTALVSSEKKAYIYKKCCNRRKTNSVPYNQRTQQNYIEDASSIIESTKHYHFPYPPCLSVTFGAPYLEIPTGTTYTESDFCNYINAKIDCLLGHTTDTGKLGEQIYQSLLGYSTATTTRTIAETLHIINTDIKYYMAQQFPQVQQPVKSDPEEYENESNNPITAQAKSTVNKKPRVLSPITPSYYQTPQSRIVFNPPLETQLETPRTPENPHPWNQHSWTKSLGEYGSLFGNLNPAASQTEGNPSTWEQPPAQNLAESASPLMEKTVILQLIGSSDKKKQPALAPREHSNMRTPIPLNITSNTPPINWIMAYRNIAKLEKFFGEEDNTYSWIIDAKKAITTNGWNDDRTVQALPFFLTGTADSWYQSLAEKPTSFTEFKLAFLQYFCDPNTLIRLQNQFSIIKQKDHEAITTYLRQFNQILHQILAIKRDYYTASAEQEANHTQAVNLAINRTSDINAKITQLSEKLTQKIEEFLAGTTGTNQPPQWRKNNNNSRYLQQQNHLIPTTATTARNLDTSPVTAKERSWTKIKETHTSNPDISKTWYPNIPYLRINCPYMHNKFQLLSTTTNDTSNPSLSNFPLHGPSRPIPHSPAQSRLTPTGYPNQASYFGLTEDQGFDKSTPQTKSNIPPVTITEDTTLATIFSFDIDNLNTHSLFSEAAINQDKPIMALYTDARVEGIDIKLILDSGSAGSIITKQLMDQLGCQVDHATTARIITADRNTKTPIGEINNFPFEINGIQIPTKVLVMEATQYQALIKNDWLSKANATFD